MRLGITPEACQIVRLWSPYETFSSWPKYKMCLYYRIRLSVWLCTSLFRHTAFLGSWTEFLVCGREESDTKPGNSLVYKEELFPGV